jgi:Na+-driven multidrug efflux pump
MTVKIKDMTAGSPLKLIVTFALPLMVGNIFQQLYTVVDTMVVGKALGVDALAALGATDWLYWMMLGMIQGVTQGFGILMAREFGAKQYERARKGARFGILASVILAEIIGIVIYFTAPYLIGMFDSNPEVIRLGVQQARTVSLFFCLLAFSHAVAAVCRGAGKAFVPMFVMLSIWCGIRILYIQLIMTFVGEIQYIYWAYPMTWALSSIVYFIYYNCSDWIHGFDRKKGEL